MSRELAWTIAVTLCFVAAVLGCTAPNEATSSGKATVFFGGTLVQSGVARSVDIRVAGDRIASIGPASESPNSDGLDLSGYFVVPGLVDMHVHLPPCWLPLDRELFLVSFLRNGVTTVRETGSVDGALPNDCRESYRWSPRIFGCGPALDGVEGLVPRRVVATVGDAEVAVSEIADAGGACVKVYNDVHSEVLPAIQKEAKRRGIPVIGHVPYGNTVEDGLVDEVQHLSGTIASEMIDAHAPFLSASRAWGELSKSRAEEVVEASERLGLSHTPTLVGFARLAELRRTRGLLRSKRRARYLHEILWDSRFLGISGVSVREAELIFQRRSRQMGLVVRRLAEEGVPIIAGTDTPALLLEPGASLHAELRLLRDAGLTVAQALHAATKAAGLQLPAPRVGSVRAGSAADFLILREDPRLSLQALESIEAVVIRGERLSVDELVARSRVLTRSRARRFVNGAINAVGQAALWTRMVP